jgi:glycine/D-amino acid oxidase-like deaminating enzyme
MEHLTKAIQRRMTTDVLVVGSGSAGATAAITAARQGASVILVERYGFMGGISTQVLDTFYGFYTPGEQPRKVVGGTPDLVLEALERHDALILRPNTYGAGQGITYDPEILKIVWEQIALQHGVRLLYHTFVLETLLESDRVTGVVGVNKAGLVHIEAKVVVDASGDADIAAGAGVPFEGAHDIPVQSLTTTFKLVNVDVPRARAVSKNELHALMAQASESGAYDLPRKEGSVHITPYAGMMATNMTRVGNIDPTDPEQLTYAEVEGRRQSLEYTRFLKDKVPGYEQAVLGALSTQIGVRESRRIYGEYRLSRADVLGAQKFEDAIAQCGAPIEEHHAGGDTRWEYLPEGETYDIPYRCLVPQKAEGLLVAGRCLSADHDAHASVRSMGQCMAMGQAAGAAAALAAADSLMPREVDIQTLREKLVLMGAVL